MSNKVVTEKQALGILGISNFAQMTNDKINQFAALSPNMSPEVVKAAIEQFPDYREMAQNLAAEYKESVDKLVSSNNESMNNLYATCDKILSSLQDELKNDNLTSADRERIEDKMIEIAHILSEKDTGNKNFLATLAGFAVGAVGLVLGVGGLILGIKKSDD